MSLALIQLIFVCGEQVFLDGILWQGYELFTEPLHQVFSAVGTPPYLGKLFELYRAFKITTNFRQHGMAPQAQLPLTLESHQFASHSNAAGLASTLPHLIHLLEDLDYQLSISTPDGAHISLILFAGQLELKNIWDILEPDHPVSPHRSPSDSFNAIV